MIMSHDKNTEKTTKHMIPLIFSSIASTKSPLSQSIDKKSGCQVVIMCAEVGLASFLHIYRSVDRAFAFSVQLLFWQANCLEAWETSTPVS